MTVRVSTPASCSRPTTSPSAAGVDAQPHLGRCRSWSSTSRLATPSAPSSVGAPIGDGVDLGPGVPAQLGQGPGGDGPALADDADPVGERLDLGEDVAGEQHGDALGSALADDLLEGLLHQRVQPGGRLVEHQQLDLGGERGDQRDLLPVALGVVARPLGRVEVEALDQLRAPVRADAAVHLGEHVDALAAAEARPQASRRRARRRAAGAGVPRAATGSRPNRLTSPPDLRISPSRIRIVVDFPAPLGPRKPCTSPRWTSRSSPSSAAKSPKRLTRPEARTTGSLAAAPVSVRIPVWQWWWASTSASRLSPVRPSSVPVARPGSRTRRGRGVGPPRGGATAPQRALAVDPGHLARPSGSARPARAGRRRGRRLIGSRSTSRIRSAASMKAARTSGSSVGVGESRRGEPGRAAAG